jgi:hypothetical protein
VSTAARILYCRCAYAQVVPLEVKDEVLATLTRSAVDFEGVPDLCEMSARRDPRLKQLASGPPLRIAACYPRAVRWLFAAAESPLPQEAEVFNMRVETAEKVCGGLLKQAAEGGAQE